MITFVTSIAQRCLFAGVCLLLMVTSRGVLAQDRFSVEDFDPTPDQNGGLLALYGARTLPQGAYGVSLLGSYGREPLTLKSSDSGNKLGELVGSVGTLQLMGAFGIVRRLDVGVAVPVHRMSKGSPFGVNPGAGVQNALLTSDEYGLGDVRIVPRVALVEREAERGVGLALVVPVWLPTGKDDIYAGENVRVEPRLALDSQHGGFKVAANVGYQFRSEASLLNSKVDDQLRLGVGVEIPFTQILSGILEVDSQLNILDGDFGSEDAPTEALAALRLRKSGLLVTLGGGPGIVRGVGSPRYRLFAAIGYAAEPARPEDKDHDGVLDDADRCPAQAEDADGFEDADGCPDPDNDKDGVLDGDDRCASEAEDRDGFEDGDGCVDPDNDRDGVPDASDRCPAAPEDTDNWEDSDGCPEPDNDQDGVPDITDGCPEQAGPADNRGCPATPAPAPEPLAVVKDDRIELGENVYFAVNRADIEERSNALLDAIANTLKAHPEILRVQVEAHTDDTGKRFRNQQLSDQRAQAVVDALVARGVAKARLTAKGFGPDRPLVPNDSDESRAKNRRAELHIVKRADAPAPAAAPAPAPAPAPSP